MKKILALILALATMMALVACGAAPAADSAEEVDYSVITANAATQSVTIYAQINGKYFSEPSRHGVVFKDGGNGEKCILRGLCSEKDFYGALISVGGVPGDNLSLPSPDGAIIDGQKLNVTVSWEGSNGEIPFADCLKTGNGKPYVADFRFGGNIKAAYAKNTGCILCIESCPVGICSNAAYGYGVVENTKTEQFYGNADVLPADGTIVQVTFSLVA